jgi:high-affinity nickel permease
VLKDSARIHVVDTRAQADALIVGAMDELQILQNELDLTTDLIQVINKETTQ